MIDEFAKLRGRLAPEEAIHYETLAEFGVQHSNEFNNVRKAAGAYQKLLARVREYEATQRSAEESAMIDAAALDQGAGRRGDPMTNAAALADRGGA
jgi:hypothetical protein